MADVAPVVGGLVNAHTHVYSGLAPLGLPAPETPPDGLLQILERVWWRLDRALDAESLQAAARLYVAEALLAGTTALIDHHESPGFIEGSLDILADACQELGMRAIVCYGATERNGGRDEARRGLGECRRFIRDNRRPLVRGVVGLHASFTVSDETVREAAALCRELDVPLHLHVAEGQVDVDDARARGYASPLERLIALDALPSGSILAHGVHLTRDQVRAADDRGCWLVQNPRSNHANQVGYAGVLSAAGRVALGTDGFPADMVAELDALRAFATVGGDDVPGAMQRLARGPALVAERFGGIALEPVTDDLRRWAVGRQRQAIDSHAIDGRVIVARGELQTADIETIRAEAAVQAEWLWERMRHLGPGASTT